MLRHKGNFGDSSEGLDLQSLCLDHHACGLGGVGGGAIPSPPMEARGPAHIVVSRVPITVETGGATAAVPPAATPLRPAAVILRDIPENARGAAVIVPITGAEAVAVLVDAFIGPTDGITCTDTGWVAWKQAAGRAERRHVSGQFLHLTNKFMYMTMTNVCIYATQASDSNPQISFGL